MKQLCYAAFELGLINDAGERISGAPDGGAEGQDAVVVLERLRRSSKVLPSMALSFERTTTEQIGKWDEAAKSMIWTHFLDGNKYGNQPPHRRRHYRVCTGDQGRGWVGVLSHADRERTDRLVANAHS